jgi:hypothetical protein
MFLWSLVSAVLITASPADQGPPLPFVTKDVFAGECSTYGRKWVAREALPVRAEPSSSAPEVFKIPPKASFVPQTGNVVTVKAGVIRVTEQTRFHGWLAFEKPTPTQTARKGERLYLLRFNGENAYDVWFKGKLIPNVEPFWTTEDERHGLSSTPSNPTAVAESYPETRWFVRVKDSQGRTGWIDMDGAKIAGVDGCGGGH